MGNKRCLVHVNQIGFLHNIFYEPRNFRRKPKLRNFLQLSLLQRSRFEQWFAKNQYLKEKKTKIKSPSDSKTERLRRAKIFPYYHSFKVCVFVQRKSRPSCHAEVSPASLDRVLIGSSCNRALILTRCLRGRSRLKNHETD